MNILLSDTSQKAVQPIVTSLILFHIFVTWLIANTILYNKQCNFYTLLIDICFTILIESFNNLNGARLKLLLFLSVTGITYATLLKQLNHSKLYIFAYLYIGKYWDIQLKLMKIKQIYQTKLAQYKIDKLYDAFMYTITFVMGSKIFGLMLRLAGLHLSVLNQIHLVLYNYIREILPESVNTVFVGSFLMYIVYTAIIYAAIQLYKKSKASKTSNQLQITEQKVTKKHSSERQSSKSQISLDSSLSQNRKSNIHQEPGKKSTKNKQKRK